MRRIVFSVLIAVAALFWAADAAPVRAHDTGVSVTSNGEQEREKRAEAAQLTDELKAATARSTKLPSIQAAVAGRAERRRALMNDLATSNPSAVLELALTPAERDALPASVRSAVEQRVDVDGELQVLHHDFEDGHSVYESKLVKGGQETPVTFGAALGQAKPGDLVRTTGVALAGQPTVVTDQMVVVQSPTSVGTTGPQHTAIILVMAPGVSSHTYANKANTASLFFDGSLAARSARAFYLEASYGQATVTGASGTPGSASDVYGPYSIATSSCDSTTIRNQALAAADLAVDYNAYHRVVLSIVTPGCGNGGIGTIRTHSVGTYDGASQRLSISWDFNNALGSTELNGKIGGVALHEYGHNIGVWHANSLECGASAISSAACTSDEYGDPSDVMGSSGGYGHLNGVHKDVLGWLGTRKQVASAGGSYTLFPYEDVAANTKVLMVPRSRDASGNVVGYYYLEYRKPTVNWTSFTSGRPEYGDGVLVHTAGIGSPCLGCSPEFLGPGGGGDSHIVDTQPASIGGTNDFVDAPIAEGQSFVDPGSGVSVQVTSTEPGTANVSLSFAPPLRTIQTLVYPENVGTVAGSGVYAPGQRVTLTAAPAGCFQYWRENRSNQAYPNPYTFTVAGDRALEAVFSTGACATPPPNDTFPGATVTTGQHAATTSGATTQSGEPVSFSCGGSAVTTGRTAWYTVTPPATSQLTLATVGSGYDTVLAVYTGNAVNSLTPVVCNDDHTDGMTSQVQFTGQAGVSYRVQVGGYNGAGGSTVLNVSVAVVEADVRQEGPIQVSGDLTVGAAATIAVAVKNYGTVPTPAMHPVVDGSTPTGQTWRANAPQPASATIQPGQTVTFTLQQPLTAPGGWSTSSVSLWNDTFVTHWKALPANGQSQQVGFAVSMTCNTPRPKVNVQTSLAGDGRLAVQVTVGAPETGNRLTGLQFGTDSHTSNTNAAIDLPGIGNNRAAPTSAMISGAPASYTFYVRRQAANVPVTLPLTVTDYCGTWQTVVGGGTGAGF